MNCEIALEGWFCGLGRNPQVWIIGTQTSTSPWVIEFWDIGNSEIRGAINFFLENFAFVGDPISAGRPLFAAEASVFEAGRFVFGCHSTLSCHVIDWKVHTRVWELQSIIICNYRILSQLVWNPFVNSSNQHWQSFHLNAKIWLLCLVRFEAFPDCQVFSIMNVVYYCFCIYLQKSKNN